MGIDMIYVCMWLVACGWWGFAFGLLVGVVAFLTELQFPSSLEAHPLETSSSGYSLLYCSLAPSQKVGGGIGWRRIGRGCRVPLLVCTGRGGGGGR